MTPRLEIVDVALGYEGKLFRRQIDLSIEPGQIVAILGPSGSGKSTLLSEIAGVLPCPEGVIRVDGRDVTHAPIHERGIGLLFQEPLLFPHLNVEANISYGLRRHGWSREDSRDRTGELLRWLGLDGYQRRRIDELSGGQAQRIALARAIAPQPAVLGLDEPFSALDTDLRQRLAVEVAAMLRDAGVSALHITHDAHEAHTIADRVVELSSLGTSA